MLEFLLGFMLCLLTVSNAICAYVPSYRPERAKWKNLLMDLLNNIAMNYNHAENMSGEIHHDFVSKTKRTLDEMRYDIAKLNKEVASRKQRLMVFQDKITAYQKTLREEKTKYRDLMNECDCEGVYDDHRFKQPPLPSPNFDERMNAWLGKGNKTQVTEPL